MPELKADYAGCNCDSTYGAQRTRTMSYCLVKMPSEGTDSLGTLRDE